MRVSSQWKKKRTTEISVDLANGSVLCAAESAKERPERKKEGKEGAVKKLQGFLTLGCDARAGCYNNNKRSTWKACSAFSLVSVPGEQPTNKAVKM